MSDRSLARLRRELAALSLQGLDWPELARRASAAIRREVAFEMACWHSLDPETLLLTGAVKEGIDRDDPRVPHYEATVDDVNKFAFLARSSPPVGILSLATHGNPSMSARFRDILQPLGIGWELRAVFRVDLSAWGACSLYRTATAPDFRERDAAVMSGVSNLLGDAFRRSLLLHGIAMPSNPHGPGLILLDAADETVALTPAAERWVKQLFDVGPTGDRRLPAAIYAVASRARASGPARARALSQSGGWLVLHSNNVVSGEQNLVAVIIEPAQRGDVARLTLEAYGLSSRESQIAELVLEGRSTVQIAAELHLSPLTIQDYLKSVFDKTGVHSRRELVGRLLARRSA
jgi:DNA-binding CsgD family transcriptional regulator